MKVTSLDLAKQLKEAGYPQIGKFFWEQVVNLPDWDTEDPYYIQYYDDEEPIENPLEYRGNKIIAVCPTADEILDQLPSTLIGDEGMRFDLNIWRDIRVIPIWIISYWWDEDSRRKSNMKIEQTEDNSLADAVAKMWLYLKKQELL